MPDPKLMRFHVTPDGHEPGRLRVASGDERALSLDLAEAEQLAAELLRHLPPERAAVLCRETLGRPEVRKAASEQAAAALLADVQGPESGAGRAGLFGADREPPGEG